MKLKAANTKYDIAICFQANCRSPKFIHVYTLQYTVLQITSILFKIRIVLNDILWLIFCFMLFAIISRNLHLTFSPSHTVFTGILLSPIFNVSQPLQ
jgi:uncharacterized membrane protein